MLSRDHRVKTIGINNKRCNSIKIQRNKKHVTRRHSSQALGYSTNKPNRTYTLNHLKSQLPASVAPVSPWSPISLEISAVAIMPLPTSTGVAKALCACVCDCACILLARQLQNGLKDFDQILLKYSIPWTDELFRF